MFVIVVGPIDYWWNSRWNTPEHTQYKRHRDNVCRLLVAAGHLVYRPHEAFKGAWDETAQAVNDAAIDRADIMVNVRPPDVPAPGTEAEIDRFFKRVSYVGSDFRPQDNYYEAPPGDFSQIEQLIRPLDNPYASVELRTHPQPVMETDDDD